MYELQSSSRSRQPERISIVVVGGGSRVWAPSLMNDLARCRDLTGNVRLYGVDPGSSRANERLGELVQDNEEAVSDWTYSAVEELVDRERDYLRAWDFDADILVE